MTQTYSEYLAEIQARSGFNFRSDDDSWRITVEPVGLWSQAKREALAEHIKDMPEELTDEYVRAGVALIVDPDELEAYEAAGCSIRVLDARLGDWLRGMPTPGESPGEG